MSNQEKQYHIQVRSGEVGTYVLLPGDPGRVKKIAAYLNDARLVSQNREYTIFTGHIENISVSVCSTGIGGPSTAIAVEELVRCGANTFIRVGTSGRMQSQVQIGDLVVATSAIRDEGTSRQYLPIEFPAVADHEVVSALVAGCNVMGSSHHVGVVHSKDSFYGEVEMDRMPIGPQLRQRWSAWVSGGALCSEMEAATLFAVSSVLGVRAGALMLAEAHDGIDRLCKTAVEGVRQLIHRDNSL